MFKRMMFLAAVVVALSGAQDAQARVLYRHHPWHPRLIVGTTVVPYTYTDVAVEPAIYLAPRYHSVYHRFGHHRRW